jgi:hypothetical protein
MARVACTAERRLKFLGTLKNPLRDFDNLSGALSVTIVRNFD